MPVASRNKLVFFVACRKLYDHMQSVENFIIEMYTHHTKFVSHTMKSIQKYFNDDLSIIYEWFEYIFSFIVSTILK